MFKQLKTVDKWAQPLDKFIDSTTGFLHARGVLARTGVQEYLGRELSPGLEPEAVYGVLRHPDDVLAEESLSGYRNAPVTDGHPSDFVTSENYKDLNRGSCSETKTYKKDGIDYIDGYVTIMDTALIAELKDGKLEISAGYYSDTVEEEGEYLGTPYQFRQKNIKINHVAIVSRGRCGGNCRVVFDYATISDENKTQGKSMAIIKIGEIEHEVPEEVATEFSKLMAAIKGKEEEAETMTGDVEEAEKEKEKAVATADELREQLRTAKRTTSDSAVNLEVEKRVKLLKVADEMGVKITVSDEATMKKAILVSKYPELMLDGKTAAYIDARFDVMTEGRDAAKDSHKKIADEHPEQKATGTATAMKDEEY